MNARMIRQTAALMRTLVIGIAVGFLLLTAVYCLPVEPMAAHVRASVPALNGEWGSEDAYEQLIKGYESTQLDNSTDAVMMLAAVHESDRSVWVQAAEGRSYSGGDTAFQTLLAYAEGQTLDSAAVARYWHGYLVLLKPLLLVLSYLDIRMLLTLAQGAMLTAVVAGMCRRNLCWLTPAFAISMICITPSAAGFSLQFSTAFCTALSGMIALLYLPGGKIKKWGCGQLFLILGMVTSYVDYLTYPLVTLGLPLCLCLFLYPEEDAKAEWLRFVSCCVCWAFGYFGMWAGKWLIAGLLSEEPWFWANLVAKIKQRSAGESDQVVIGYGNVLAAQFKPFFKRAYLMAAVLTALGWLAAWLRTRCYPVSRFRASRACLLVCLTLMPFAWYLVTQNHSFNHAFYTSRSLAVSVFAAASLFSTLLKGKGQPEA